MTMTNEEVMPDYPRSMKQRTCPTHPHARDVTPDVVAATPCLRRSLCPLCNKNASSESRVCVPCECLVFGWFGLVLMFELDLCNECNDLEGWSTISFSLLQGYDIRINEINCWVLVFFCFPYPVFSEHHELFSLYLCLWTTKNHRKIMYNSRLKHLSLTTRIIPISVMAWEL